MELHKLTTEELKGYDAARLRETEGELRKELVTIRMDIYTAKSATGSKVRGLKKSLARLLTVRNHQAKAGQPAAPKAAKTTEAKTASAPKAAKTKAAPKAKAKSAAPKAKAKSSTKTATKK